MSFLFGDGQTRTLAVLRSKTSAEFGAVNEAKESTEGIFLSK
jgi:hypothetical protein